MQFFLNNKEINWSPENLLIAGYTAKDQASLKEHIRELEEIGVAPPPKVPMVYQLSPELLTIKDTISTVKNDANGEIEFVLINIHGEWYIGLGSDHTDRVLETVSVQKSKQVCSKPISDELWGLNEIIDSWDKIEIKSWYITKGKKQLYQSGTLGDFLSPEELLKIIEDEGYQTLNTAIFCGTPPVVSSDGLVYGEEFVGELYNTDSNKKIELNYKTHILRDAEEI